MLKPITGGVTTWTNRAGTARIGFYVDGDDDGRAESSRLAYTINGERVTLDVRIEWTPCHYGGERTWGRCPVCWRRIAMLYGGRRFACRHCRDLAYASKREDRATRPIKKAQRIRERPGGTANTLEPFPPKPPRMHSCTYLRLHAEADEAYVGGLLSAAQRIGVAIWVDPPE